MLTFNRTLQGNFKKAVNFLRFVFTFLFLGEARMARMMLRDDQWARIEELVSGKVGDRGRTGVDNRLFVG